MKRHLQIAVRDLVSYCLRSGDLVQEFMSGIRALDGIRSHQVVQKSRPKEYKSEVLISHQVESDDFVVDIGGRIDGVYQYPDRTVIDEIKSTTKSLETIEKEQNPIHWGQVKVYAYLYALRESLETIDTQLTYFHLDTGKTLELCKTFTLEELAVFFNDLLTDYLEWASRLGKWLQLRDESIRELKFPFTTYRPGQRRMVQGVYQSIRDNEQLIVEAPTGIGKTMAAIFPAVKAIGNGLVEKFFYLTAKTTGRAIAQKALQDLRAKGLMFKSLTLTAKEKICFCPESACNGEECEFARGYYDRINGAVKNVFQQDALTRDVIEAGAREFTVCPFEFSLELSLWVDCIICDYNYAFDPRVHLKRFFGEENGGKRDYTFLVDEANNLVDRSREMFSAELYKQPFLELKRQIRKDLPDVSRSIANINSQLVQFKKECEEAGKPLAHETYPESLSFPLRGFIRAAEQWLVRNIRTPYRENLISLYFDVSWFLKVAELYHTAYTTCLEQINGDFRVKLFCMDPSVQLAEAFDRCKSAIFFSATLSPIHYFRYILGCATAGELILPSPFPREHFCLPLADRVSTLYKSRERTKTAIANIINTLVKQQPGNYLIFFPSYQYMKMVLDIFLLANPLITCIVQNPGMTEAERDDFLENFTVDNRASGKTLVGFAVMGGVFGEGIDLVGDRLTGAAVVGVGLPGISLERELIKEYFNNLQDTGFQYAYLYPGMNRVFQAAGRVIRTPSDRGVVLLIGSRFSAHQYRSLFPIHWQPIRVKDDQHLKEILNQFWQTGNHEKNEESK